MGAQLLGGIRRNRGPTGGKELKSEKKRKDYRGYLKRYRSLLKTRENKKYGKRTSRRDSYRRGSVPVGGKPIDT